MNEIIRPRCGMAFMIDEAGYADILKQVRDSDFEEQLQESLELADQDIRNTVALAHAKASSELQKAVSSKDTEIHELKAKLEPGEVERKLAVSEALGIVERDRDALAEALAKAKQGKEAAPRLAEAKILNGLQKVSATVDEDIQSLKAKIDAGEVAKKLAITETVGVVEKERDELKNGLDWAALEKQPAETVLKDTHEKQLKDQNEEIERLREMKARLSNKMIGETLKQRCEIGCNRLRATSFPKAYFEKDNDSGTGSKGDYIYRDADDAGTEIVSIMIEMKNEGDETATRKRNKDFFKELRKDRTEKGCEYAVLVSLPEPDDELQNAGIVDVFHRYPKMYDIRPQFFIPIASLMRNAAMESLQHKSELAMVRAQNIDVMHLKRSSTTSRPHLYATGDWTQKALKKRLNASTKTSRIWEISKKPCISRPTICGLPRTRVKT